MSLEELYRYLNWRMNPADERARERFERIREFLSQSLINSQREAESWTSALELEWQALPLQKQQVQSS